MAISSGTDERRTETCDACLAQFIQRLHRPLPPSSFRGPPKYESLDSIDRTRLADDRATVHAYDACLEKIDSIRHELMIHREEALCLVRRREHYLSSFRKIPNELWIEIFSLVCSKSSNANAYGDEKWWPSTTFPIEIGYRKTLSPYVLSQVCHRWRDIAVHYEGLWVNISIDVAFSVSASGGQRHLMALDALKLALERSGKSALTIRLQSHPMVEEEYYRDVPPSVWAPFREAFSRTESLEAAADLFRQIDFGGCLSFPRLRQVWLDSHSPLLPLPRPSAREQLHALFAAPRLQYLSLERMKWIMAMAPFPFRDLTSFTCQEAMTRSELAHLARCCPRLLDLAIRSDSSVDVSGSSGALQFPKLQSLTLNPGWSPMSFLGHLNTPSLTSLAYKSSPCTPDRLEVLSRFLSRSQCPLRALGLTIDEDCFTGVPRDAWSSFITNIPSLVNLDVTLHMTSVEISRSAIHQLLSVLRLKEYDDGHERGCFPYLTIFSLVIEQRGYWCMDGPDIHWLLDHFLDVAATRRPRAQDLPSDMAPLQTARCSVQFQSWGNDTSGYGYYKELEESESFDAKRVRCRVLDLIASGLEVEIEIGSHGISALHSG
ncbi:hypothetical protein PM082_022813 [Marasmius tenuissimus]|nr:hypothetical protein PM082_001913 [Marasmius tenuissimus]KAJ8094220.1 hypothetical protein PM082_006757 [Marasmius tenuissimus]KAJ8095707.1 hypothetical protein PM082_022813 [Marasmius tenuissimus]